MTTPLQNVSLVGSGLIDTAQGVHGLHLETPLYLSGLLLGCALHQWKHTELSLCVTPNTSHRLDFEAYADELEGDIQFNGT